MATYLVRVLYGDEEWVRGSRSRRKSEGQTMVVGVTAWSPDQALVEAVTLFVEKWSPLYDAADILGVEITGVREQLPVSSGTPPRPRARRRSTEATTSNARGRSGRDRRRA